MPLLRVFGETSDALVGHSNGRRGRSCLTREACSEGGTAWVLGALAFTLLVAPLAAHAQHPPKVPRIGVLRAAVPRAAYFDAFREGLRELGYVEGQNIAIEQRYAHGVVDRLPGLAAEQVRLKMDVIVVGGTPDAEAA